MNHFDLFETPLIEILKYFGLNESIIHNITQKQIIDLIQRYYLEVAPSK